MRRSGGNTGNILSSSCFYFGDEENICTVVQETESKKENLICK